MPGRGLYRSTRRQVEGQNPLHPFTGTKRFGELRKLLPETTQRMSRHSYVSWRRGVIDARLRVVPPKVEYSISKRGETLKPIVDAMWHWGRSFLDNQPDDLEIDRDPAPLPTPACIQDGLIPLLQPPRSSSPLFTVFRYGFSHASFSTQVSSTGRSGGTAPGPCEGTAASTVARPR